MEFAPIATLSDFKDVMSRSLPRGRKFITNSTMLPAVIDALTKKQQLSWAAIKNGLIILRKNADFYGLLFYLLEPVGDHSPIDLNQLDKPVVLDLLVHATGLSRSQKAAKALWLRSGFNFHKRYIRFRLDLPSGDRSARFTTKLDNHKYELGHALPVDIPAIRRLWYEALDPYSVPLPDEEELRTLTRTRQIICVRTRAGDLAAVSRPEIRGKIAYNWHTVVDTQHRGQGLVNAMKSLLYLDHPNVTRFYAWMEEDNQRMIEIDKRTGYQPDGLEDLQYLFIPEASGINRVADQLTTKG